MENKIDFKEFEDLVKEIDSNKYHISRTIRPTADGGIELESWQIFNKNLTEEDYFSPENIALISSYNNNTLEDIKNFIKNTKKNEETKLNKIITNNLIELGISLNHSGFRYWHYIITLAFNNPNKNIMDLYKMTGKYFNKGIAAVERCLRFSLDKIENNLTKQYGIKKINNKGFINFFITRYLD